MGPNRVGVVGRRGIQDPDWALRHLLRARRRHGPADAVRPRRGVFLLAFSCLAGPGLAPGVVERVGASIRGSDRPLRDAALLSLEPLGCFKWSVVEEILVVSTSCGKDLVRVALDSDTDDALYMNIGVVLCYLAQEKTKDVSLASSHRPKCRGLRTLFPTGHRHRICPADYS